MTISAAIRWFLQHNLLLAIKLCVTLEKGIIHMELINHATVFNT